MVPLKARFRGATDVFIGKFSAVSRTEPFAFDVEVMERFAGTAEPRITLKLAGMCSTSRAQIGHESLIFASRSEAGLLIENGCASHSMDDQWGQREARTLRRRSWFWRWQHRVRNAFNRGKRQ